MRAPAVVFAVVAALPSTLHAQQRRCGPTENPKSLPPVSALADSARIVQGLTRAVVGPKGLLFSLVYTEADSFPEIHTLEASLDSAELLLANTLVPHKSKKVWAVRLRISGSDSLAVTIERSTYCPPVVVTKEDRLHN
jgi:hypothetical protein